MRERPLRQILGRRPPPLVARGASYEWFESPNIHFLTVHDFEALAALESLVLERRCFLAGHRKVEWQPNLLAEVAVFLVRRGARFNTVTNRSLTVAALYAVVCSDQSGDR